jgi:hypothetical protein
MAIDRAPYNALVDDDGSGISGSIWNKNQIKTVLLDPIDKIGEWIPYTPVWTAASGAAPVIGNGGLTGSYCVIGAVKKTVIFRITLASGSTTTFGGNYWFFTVPLPAVVSGRVPLGAWLLQRAGVSDHFAAVIQENANQIIGMMLANGSPVGPTIPFAWVPGDGFALQGTYQAA